MPDSASQLRTHGAGNWMPTRSFGRAEIMPVTWNAENVVSNIGGCVQVIGETGWNFSVLLQRKVSRSLTDRRGGWRLDLDSNDLILDVPMILEVIIIPTVQLLPIAGKEELDGARARQCFLPCLQSELDVQLGKEDDYLDGRLSKSLTTLRKLMERRGYSRLERRSGIFFDSPRRTETCFSLAKTSRTIVV